MAVVVEELLVTLQAQYDQFGVQMQLMQRETDNRLGAVERRFASFEQRLKNSVSAAALNARNALAGIGTALTGRELLGYADAWTQVERALKNTADVFQVTVRSASEMADLAIRTRSDLEAVTKLYSRTAVAAQRLGYDEQAAADATEAFAKALKLGSANASEQTSAILQFSQALLKGVLNGDEFRTIMESAGVVQEALSKQLGVTGGELIKLAEQGKITARTMVDALLSIKPTVDQAFEGAPATIAESFQNLNTALTEYVGKAATSAGVTQGLAGAMQSVADNLDNIAKGTLVALAAAAIAFGGAVVTALGGVVASVAAAGAALGTVSGAVQATAVALGAGAVAARLFGDQVTVAADKGTTLEDVILAIQGIAKDGLGAAWSTFMIPLTALFNMLTDSLRGAGIEAQDLLVYVRDAVNGIIGAMTAMGKVVQAGLVGFFHAIPEQVHNAIEAALDALEWFVQSVATVLNKPWLKVGNKTIIQGMQIDIDSLKFDRMETAFKGSTDRMKRLWSEALDIMADEINGNGPDYIGAFGERADQIRQARQWREGTTVNRTPRDVPVQTPAADNTANAYTREIERMRARTEALRAEATAIGQTVSEQERAVAMQELLTDAQKAGLKVTPALLSDMDTLARAYANATTELQMLQQLQRVKDDTEAMAREIELTGLYGYELKKARIEQELLNEAKRLGVDLSDVRRQEIADTAAAAAATAHLKDALDSVRDTASDALKGFITDLRNGKSGMEALGGALDRIADKLLDMAADQLIQGALGGLLGGAGGSAGVLSLFGFANGGVMTPGGPANLQRFAKGGVSTKAAIFGEAGPEAAVPLPDGRRIPVELRMPDTNAASRQALAGGSGPVSVTVAPVFNLGGGVTAEELARVKTEVAAEIPRAVQSGLNTAFDRRARFARIG